MPSGLPPPSLLTSRKIHAFTLDTSILRAAGYHFEQGALRQLAHQLPPWLNLWMSSIVVSEVSRQRLAAAQAAAEQAKLAWGNLTRHLDIPASGGAMPAEVDQLASQAEERFDDQLERFLAAHDGEVVELVGEWLAPAMFQAYFAGAAPFSGGGKKHEFPDAAALLSLDELAKKRDTFLLAVSMDDGWHAYCETSERMYCLRKLSELAGLFRSTGAEAQALRSGLSAYLREARAAQELNLLSVIRDGLRSLGVRASLPSYIAPVAGVEVTEIRLTAVQIDADAVGIWLTSGPAGDGAAEVSVECTVELELRFFDQKQSWMPNSGDRFDDEGGFVVRSLSLNLALELAAAGGAPEFPQMITRVSLVPTEYRLRLADDEVSSRYRRPIGAPWEDADDIPF